VANEF